MRKLKFITLFVLCLFLNINIALAKNLIDENQLCKFAEVDVNMDTVTNIDTAITLGEVTFVNSSNFIISVRKIGEDQRLRELGPKQKVKVECKLGDSFEFKVSSADGFEALPYTVDLFDEIYNIKVGKRYQSGRGGKLPNTKASRHSFDIKTIDPIFIDYNKKSVIRDKNDKKIGAGGMRLEIFEQLKNEDLDWYNGDGGYALKSHFSFDLLNETNSSYETKIFSSSVAFGQAFSANVSAESPVGGGSASLSFATDESENENNIYSFYRTKISTYSLGLNNNELVLTENFKKAIMALPKEYDERKYNDFIENWGTHYPISTTYGGTLVSTYKLDAKEFSG